MPPLKAVEKGGNIVYVGIAADEPNRFHNLSDTKKSPLVEIGWNEAYCRQWCEENDLLSPIYTTVARGVLVLPQSICKSIAITAQKLSRFMAADAQMGTMTALRHFTRMGIWCMILTGGLRWKMKDLLFQAKRSAGRCWMSR